MVGTNDWPGVVRAADDLAADINRVTGKSPKIFNNSKSAGKNVVIIGTVGKSEFIDRLIREKKIDVSAISNKWESFFLQVVPNPFPGIKNALVICGSDKRGTIYGIYDLSEQIGVSPWYFWADAPPKHHDKLFVRAGKFEQGSPSVKYRGIFLNDEAPDLTDWVREKYGTVPGMPGVANYGRGFYTNLFELILRLRGNYLWPAMWNNAFNEDDPENPKLADQYGVVMGTSHQEPMLRAQKEWDRGPGKKYGNWNYNNTNQQPVLQKFWRDGIRRNKDFESIITLGLRAENDSGTPIGKDLTEQIVGVQQKILAEEMNPDLSEIPQLWCLYKEVQDFYNEGLRVPDDVTMLWAGDNWGNVRRLPTPDERQRSGGAGIYYHFDYHGGPRNYQWINTSPISKIWDQLSLAKEYGANRIWIVNVGHFKGYEFPVEFFMHLAWNTSRWSNTNLDEYTQLWAQREFGPAHADEIADIISQYTKFNGRRKPELLDAKTYSLVDYDEFENVVADYESLAAKAKKISEELPAASRDAFYELVLFPTKASAGLNAMYLAAAKNNLYAKQGRTSANDFAAQTRELFAAQTNLMAYFNRSFAGGKWDHFMDQPYIGYTNWNEPLQNNLNAVHLTEFQTPDAAAMGVAVENSETAATNGEISLPQFDSFNRQTFYVDVFNQGKTPFEFSAASDSPWIVLSETGGKIEKDKRIWVSVDWKKIPNGKNDGEIEISGAGANVKVKVTAFNPSEPTRDSLQGFVEGDGCVSIEAEHFTRKIDAGANRWIKIPNYGHTLSAMRADGPAYVEATLGKDSPCLEYKMYLFSTGKVDVVSTVGPTLNFLHGRPLRYAVSFDDEAPQTVTIVPANFNAQNGNLDWEESVKNNYRHVESSHALATPGYHTLKIWMIDPAVAVEKIIVNTGGVKPSYLARRKVFINKSSMKLQSSTVVFIVTMTIVLAGRNISNAAGLVAFEAESGALGSNFTNGTDGEIQFISISTDTVNSGNPGNANRVASYTVVFPEAGTYNLFARGLVGPDGFNDDSLFYGNGFGVKSPTTDNDWMLVNGLASGGFTAASDVVSGNGSAGGQVWKWVNLSQFNPSNSGTETPITFTVSAGNLTQTFQIGARENGLDMDKFAFGTVGTSFTVSNLDTGTVPIYIVLTNTFSGPDGIALHRFNPLNNGLNLDGANPAAGLTLLGNVLCGTTLNGGVQGAGTAFYVSLDGTNFNAFRSFTNAPDAGNSQGNLVAANGNLFGTTIGGGGNGVGTIFLAGTNGNLSILKNFSTVSADEATNSDGASPNASLALSGGTIFGTTTAGGAAANGVIFSISNNGSAFAVLHDFSALDSNTGTNVDGALSCGGLVLFGDTLYGTASAGGAGGAGVIFSIGTNGGNFTTLHSFTPLDALTATNNDGAFPIGGLIVSNDIIYGTTIAGGTSGNGVIFSVGTNGLGFTVLHNFSPADLLTGTNSDGASPCAALTLVSNVLYGTTSADGAGTSGTVFSVNTNGVQFQTIYSFTAVNSTTGTNRDGAFPVAGVLPLGNSLYGTTFGGGPAGLERCLA